MRLAGTVVRARMEVQMNAVLGAGDASADPSKIRIRVWLTDPASWATNAVDVAASAAAEFNRLHPGYLVEIESHDFRTMPRAVAEAADRGAQPDIAEYHHTVVRAALDSRGQDGTPLFTPVEPAVAGRTEILGHPVVIDDMLPAVRDFYRYRGVLTCVPRTASTVVLYANMDVLTRAGITEPPRTWREMTAACQAIRKSATCPAYGAAWPNGFLFFLQALSQQRGLLADHENGRSGRAETVDLTSPQLMAYVRWWQRLHRDGGYLYTGKPVDFQGCFAAFEEQRVAMILSSSVDASHLFDRGERQGFRVKMAPIPHNDEVPPAGTVVGGFSMWLAAGLDPAKRDGALAFMQYVNSPRHAAEWARRHHRIPLTRAAVELLDRDGWYADNPDFRVGRDQVEAADGSPAALGPLLGGHAGVVGELTAAMHDVLTVDADPTVRFSEANERAQRVVDAYHACCDGPPTRTPNDLAVSI